MKIILSRKGCDSGFGGMPGIILPDGRIIFVPIPGEDTETIRYGDIVIDQETGKLVSLMGQVSPCMRLNEKKFNIDRETKCHLDPDLSGEMYPRKEGWRGCFGQGGAAQTVLQKSNVGVGDLFLFFGWFNHTEERDGKLRFCKGQGFHMIFGWMQIGQMIRAGREAIPDWMSYHPHAGKSYMGSSNNCIYVGKEHLSWEDSICGYGVFPKFRKELVLSKEGMSRSRWALPERFRGLSITYHSDASWKDGYFQSACRGQEFVFEENEAVLDWAKEIIAYS